MKRTFFLLAFICAVGAVNFIFIIIYLFFAFRKGTTYMSAANVPERVSCDPWQDVRCELTETPTIGKFLVNVVLLESLGIQRQE